MKNKQAGLFAIVVIIMIGLTMMIEPDSKGNHQMADQMTQVNNSY